MQNTIQVVLLVNFTFNGFIFKGTSRIWLSFAINTLIALNTEKNAGETEDFDTHTDNLKASII